MKRLLPAITSVLLPLVLASSAWTETPTAVATVAPPATATGAAGAAQTGTFKPPYPQRTNPFQLPDNKAALAQRREAIVQQIDLRLKGFVNVGSGTRAVVVIDGEVLSLASGERHGDIQVLEVAPPTLTLQRGRNRWTESLLDNQTAKSIAQSR